MRKSSRAYAIAVTLALSIVLVSCGQGNRSDQAKVVGFDALMANPVQYAGQQVCTEGIHVDGFEASGLAAAMFEKDGHPQLTEPVIWVEGADLRSREDCIRTDTTPSFEFCQAMVCGVFETGARYGHGGAYAYQLRGQDMPAPATSTLPTGAPRQGKAPLVEPPPAILAISGQEQVSGIGTYCWTEPTGEETALSLCADMAGIPTAEEPLVAGSPFTAAFRLAPEERPGELLLEVIPVTVEDEFEEWPAGWRGWTYKEGERHSLPLEREPSLELSLEPGLYVLNLMGWWQAWGDASYGFLVQVQPLPNVYDQVFHNQCCEAAIHNAEALGDAVLFHALRNGTWYLVEASVYDGERAGTYHDAILSRVESSETLRTTVLFDGQRHYEFHAAIPPMAEEEYGAIVSSSRLAGR